MMMRNSPAASRKLECLSTCGPRPRPPSSARTAAQPHRGGLTVPACCRGGSSSSSTGPPPDGATPSATPSRQPPRDREEEELPAAGSSSSATLSFPGRARRSSEPCKLLPLRQAAGSAGRLEAPQPAAGCLLVADAADPLAAPGLAPALRLVYLAPCCLSLAVGGTLLELGRVQLPAWGAALAAAQQAQRGIVPLLGTAAAVSFNLLLFSAAVALNWATLISCALNAAAGASSAVQVLGRSARGGRQASTEAQQEAQQDLLEPLAEGTPAAAPLSLPSPAPPTPALWLVCIRSTLHSLLALSLLGFAAALALFGLHLLLLLADVWTSASPSSLLGVAVELAMHAWAATRALQGALSQFARARQNALLLAT